MVQKTKSRTITDDKSQKKIYKQQCKGDIVQDIIKIRLHMQDLRNSYKKEEEQLLCPLCETEEDGTANVLKCGWDKDQKQRNIKNNTEEEWEDTVLIFKEKERKNRENLGNFVEEEEPD